MEKIDRLRWILGLTFLVCAVVTFAKGLAIEDRTVVFYFLSGVALFAAAATFFSWDLASWAALPLTKFVDSTYLGNGYAKKPPLTLDLANFYERHFRGEDALKEYRTMVHHYPDHMPAYAGMIRTLETLLDDVVEAMEWRNEAYKRFSHHELEALVAKSARQIHDEKPLRIAGLVHEDGLSLEGKAPTVGGD